MLPNKKARFFQAMQALEIRNIDVKDLHDLYLELYQTLAEIENSKPALTTQEQETLSLLEKKQKKLEDGFKDLATKKTVLPPLIFSNNLYKKYQFSIQPVRVKAFIENKLLSIEEFFNILDTIFERCREEGPIHLLVTFINDMSEIIDNYKNWLSTQPKTSSPRLDHQQLTQRVNEILGEDAPGGVKRKLKIHLAELQAQQSEYVYHGNGHNVYIGKSKEGEFELSDVNYPGFSNIRSKELSTFKYLALQWLTHTCYMNVIGIWRVRNLNPSKSLNRCSVPVPLKLQSREFFVLIVFIISSFALFLISPFSKRGVFD